MAPTWRLVQPWWDCDCMMSSLSFLQNPLKVDFLADLYTSGSEECQNRTLQLICLGYLNNYLCVLIRYLYWLIERAGGRVYTDRQPSQYDHLPPACHVSRGRQRHSGVLAPGDWPQGHWRSGNGHLLDYLVLVLCHGKSWARTILIRFHIIFAWIKLRFHIFVIAIRKMFHYYIAK